MLWPLVFVAVVGFCLSVYFHIDTFVRHRTVPEPLFFPLHIGIFVAWFPAMVAQRRLGNLQRKDFWKALMQGAPDWLRYLMYGFGAYAAVMDFMVFFVYSSARQQNDPVLTSRSFSATWMMFYLIGFVVLYGAARAQARAPKCLNGHPAAPGDLFCTRCGQPVRAQDSQASAR